MVRSADSPVSLLNLAAIIMLRRSGFFRYTGQDNIVFYGPYWDGAMRSRSAAKIVFGLMLGSLLLTSSESVSACSCLQGWREFEDAVRESPVVLVGRVAAQGKPDVARLYPHLDVAYLDVEVMESVKGPALTSVRIWDGAFGTSCAGDLRPLKVGVMAAFALAYVGSDSQEYWNQLHLSPAPEDMVIGPCGTYIEQLGTVGDAQKGAEHARRLLTKE